MFSPSVASNSQLYKSGILLFVYLLSFSAVAKVRMPAIFSDNMVLQQNANVNLWGWGKPGSLITIKSSWNKKTAKTTVNSNGKWQTVLITPTAGGPYALTISDGTPLNISNILIGDVWLCSGQSNMTMPVKGFPSNPVNGAMDEILSAKTVKVRLFDIARSTRLKPQDSLKGSWKEVSVEHVANFSATAWFFGRVLYEQLNYPIGLITSSWGGSNIETWMSKEALSAHPGIRLPNRTDSIKAPNKTPTLLYNNMINPVVGYTIKGFTWYQGESNREQPQQYAKLLPAMVNDWRNRWHNQTLPFYMLQIAPFNNGKGLSSAYLREAQINAQKAIPNSGIGILMDAGEENNIHPANKKAAGQRLAILALVKTYGLKGISAAGPIYKSSKITNGAVQITFENAENGLTSWGKELHQFEVAGADKKFYKATAVINKYGVAVSNILQVPNPVAVRYAFKDFISGELFNNEGMPASSFRTDAWPIE